MNEIILQGRRTLEGTLAVQGAKNSVLPVLAATLLHPGQTVLHRCPRLSDVDASIRILHHLGCRASWSGDDLIVDPMPGLMLAFKDFKYKLGVWGSPWVGFENFKFLFESSKFTELIRNTVLYNVSYIACGIIFPVFFAILLYQIKRNSTLKILQSCYLLPTFISSIILSYLVYAFLAPKQ